MHRNTTAVIEAPKSRQGHSDVGVGGSMRIRLMALSLMALATTSRGEVPTGSAAGARLYYERTSKRLEFGPDGGIFTSTLDDVAAYLGYGGLTGRDLQDLAPPQLMSPAALLGPCDAGACVPLQQREEVLRQMGAIPPQPDDILSTRFFAPKIMNINDPEATRDLGWRKLVRLKARPNSPARRHDIESAIILFNFFSVPGQRPFELGAESVNTQVMLVTDRAKVPAPGKPGPATLYWLDYDRLSRGGRLSDALEASFDAAELQRRGSGPTQKYFVPDGCNGCHGVNPDRPMVNYLDTDHWFDRLDNDFPALKATGLPVLVDAESNDPESAEFKVALDVIRRFNHEADLQAAKAQPKHDEVLASARWLKLHDSSALHFLPRDRTIGPTPNWSESPPEAEALRALNQYCFRCHGTIKFSVFNKKAVLEKAALIRAAIVGVDAGAIGPMPPDREMPTEARDQILKVLPGGVR